jgi:hypothetical protein
MRQEKNAWSANKMQTAMMDCSARAKKNAKSVNASAMAIHVTARMKRAWKI